MTQGTAAERQAAVPTIMNSGVSQQTDFFFTGRHSPRAKTVLCEIYHAVLPGKNLESYFPQIAIKY